MDPARSTTSDEGRGAGDAWRRLAHSHLRTIVAAALGAAVGGAYAHFIGCRTGTCPITSSVWTAGGYGLLVGAIAGWPARSR